MLTEALATADKTKGRHDEAKLYRLKETLTLQSQASPKQVENKSRTSQGQTGDKSEITDPRPLIPKAKPNRVFCRLRRPRT